MFWLFKKRQVGPKFDRSLVVPRIKNRQFREALLEMRLPADQIPVTEPLAGDLVVTYAIDLPAGFMMLSASHLNELGVGTESLRGLAVENLRRQISGINVQQKGQVFRAETGNHLDACVLLSDRFWNDQIEFHKSELVVAVPHRDLLLFCSTESSDGVQMMRGLTDRAFESGGTHALTKSFLKRTAVGWKQFD